MSFDNLLVDLKSVQSFRFSLMFMHLHSFIFDSIITVICNDINYLIRSTFQFVSNFTSIHGMWFLVFSAFFFYLIEILTIKASVDIGLQWNNLTSKNPWNSLPIVYHQWIQDVPYNLKPLISYLLSVMLLLYRENCWWILFDGNISCFNIFQIIKTTFIKMFTDCLSALNSIYPNFQNY